MKVLGFDVGIKNLAYCIVESDENGNIEICKPIKDNWNIINLIKDDSVKCLEHDCHNDVKKFSIINDKTYYFCIKHKKLHKQLINDNIITDKVLTDYVNVCQCTKSCKTKATNKYNNIYMCKKHYEMYKKKYINERKLNTYKVLVKDFTINDLKIIMLKKFMLLQDILLNVDYVSIENQPVYNNPTMKAISDVIFTWFLDRGVVNGNIKKVSFCAASNKTKITNKSEEINMKIKKGKTKSEQYKITKKMSIEECSKLLEKNSEAIEYSNTFLKKDDIFDAYSHATYYIQKNLPIMIKQNRKTLKMNLLKWDMLKEEINILIKKLKKNNL